MTDLVKIGFRADTSGLVRAERDMDKLSRAGDKTDRQLLTLKNTVGLLGGAFAAIGFAGLTREVTRYSDAYTQIQNRLKVVTNGSKELADIQQRLLDISNETRSDLDATATLYSRTARATEELGISQERLLNIIETVNKSFALSGATAQEASNAIRQLSQGLASGALRGEEFNSVAEQAPEILRAVSKETGMAVGELREFAATGGITADLLIRSLESYKDTVDEVFAESTATISQSFVIARNNAVDFVGGLEAVQQASEGFGDLIVSTSENLDALANAVGAAATVVGVSMVPALTRYVATQGAAAVAALTATPAVTGVSAAMGIQARSATVATIATNALTISTRALMGPFGLVLAAVGAAGAAFALTGSEAELATVKLEDHGEAVRKLTNEYEDLTKAQRENAALRLESRITEIDAEIERLQGLQKIRESLATDELAEILGLEAEEMEGAEKNAAKLQAAIDDLVQEKEKLLPLIEKVNKATEDSAEAADKASKATDKAVESFHKQSLALTMQRAELTMTSDEYEVMRARMDAIAYEANPAMVESIEAQVRANQKLKKSLESVDTALDGMMNDDGLFGFKDGIEEVATASEFAGERIEAAFADVWMNMWDGFESVVDGMKNAFKRMLAEMAHLALTRPILISMGLGGMLPGAANAGALGGLLGGASGGGGLLGGLGGLSSMVTGLAEFAAGGLGTFGSGLGLGLDALFSAGIGSQISGIGALFGGGNIMAGLGAALPLAGLFAGGLGLVDSLTGGGLFGTSYKPTGQDLSLGIGGGNVTGSTILEESKKKSFFRGTRRRETETPFDTTAINDIFDSVEMSIIDAAEMLDITSVEQTISRNIGRFDFSRGRIPQYIRDIMTTNVEVPIEQYLKNFSRSMRVDITDMSEEEVQQLISDWVSSTTDAMIKGVFGDFISEVQREGESAGQALDRVIQNMQAFTGLADMLSLNFDATGKAAAIASTNIVDMVGGLDALNQLSTQYYNSFFSEAERFDHLQGQLESAFDSLGLSMVDSRQEFRAIVEGLDLTTESGQETFAALMQLVPGMDQYLGYLEQQGLAMGSLNDAAKAAFESLQASIGAEKDRAAAVLESARTVYAAEISRIEESRSALESTYQTLSGGVQDAEQALRDSYNSEIQAINEAANARISGLQQERGIVQSNMSSLLSLAQRLNGALGGPSVVDALGAARSGDFGLAGQLGDTSISSSGFGSASDFAAAQALQQNRLQEIADLAGEQASVEERTLNRIDAQIATTKASSQAQIDALTEQLNAVLGVDTSIMTMDEAIKAYQDAQLQLDELGYEEQLSALARQEEAAMAQLDLAEQAYQDEIERLDNILIASEEQLNALLGIDTSVMDLGQAIRDFTAIIRQDRERSKAIEQQPVEPKPSPEAEELKSVKAEQMKMNDALRSIAKNDATTAKILQRLELNGIDTRAIA